MKKYPSIKTVGVFTAIFILTACIGPLPQQPTQTATIIPTASPIPTATPNPAFLLLGDYQRFSPDDMHSDLDDLFHMIETTHPNPYANRSKAEVDLERQRVYDELSQPMTIIEYHRKISPLVNSLGDSHTAVGLPDETSSSILQNEMFFPFDAQMENGRAYIVSTYTDKSEVKLGDELLKVNGVPISKIQEEAKRYFPPGRHINYPAFWLLFGSLPEYQVKLLPRGSGMVRGLDEDQFALSFITARTGDTYRQAILDAGQQATRHESVWEATYRAPITPWLAVQPNIQYVINPGTDAEIRNATVLGVRFELAMER